MRTGSEASAENVVAPTNRCASRGHDRNHVRAEVDEASADLDGLVGGDPARDAQDDAAPGKARHALLRRRFFGALDLGLDVKLVLAGLGALVGDLVRGDLLEGDRQRLA